MESFISVILSLFGLSQRSSHVISSKRSEAHRLNTEFETLLHKAEVHLRAEHMHLKHRINSITEQDSELHDTLNGVIGALLSEIDAGKAMAKGTRANLDDASTLRTLAQWDYIISSLYQQKSAAELQVERSRTCIEQFHRILDNNDISQPPNATIPAARHWQTASVRAMAVSQARHVQLCPALCEFAAERGGPDIPRTKLAQHQLR